MEIKQEEAFSLLYPRAFIIVINSLHSPDNMLTNSALYPWVTSVGKGNFGLLFVELEYIILIGAQCKVQRRKECNHAASARLQITSGPASCRTSSGADMLIPVCVCVCVCVGGETNSCLCVGSLWLLALDYLLDGYSVYIVHCVNTDIDGSGRNSTSTFTRARMHTHTPPCLH